MKLKLTFLSFISSLSLCAITSSFAIAEVAQENAPRWFEVEVILFKQLGDKALLKEQFPDSVKLPKYDNHFDLLTPYLQPDIASLKQLLPACEPLLEIQHIEEKKEPFVAIKSLTEIEQRLAEESEITIVSDILVDTSLEDNFDERTKEPAKESLKKLTETLAKTDKTLHSNITENDEEEQPKGLTKKQRDLVKAAEDKFKEIHFFDAPHYPYFPNKTLCTLPSKFFSPFDSDIALIKTSDDSFPINKVPTTIDSDNAKYESQPYLMSKESLQLRDIITRLKWSKNFKPLLHIGWRQIGITKKKAVPMKIFAGEHLEENYQQGLRNKLEAEQAALIAVNTEDSDLNTDQTNSDTTAPLSPVDPESLTAEMESFAEQQVLTPVQQKQVKQLENIFEQISLLDENSLSEEELEQLIFNIGKEPKINITNSPESTDKQLTTPLIKPVQPWLLDGFIKIHLDHYLYIAADLNIVSLNVNTPIDINNNSQPMKAINFNQNRRVITGEVHYFDHPYIGMIIQIRRFDPSKPDDEAVSQAVR